MNLACPISDDPRWAQVAARDRAADGVFWYAVATTGVYCRPSCPSRRPAPRNVSFHDAPAAARAAGYRPCLRCRPDGDAEGAALVARACRLIEESETPPPLAAVAACMGLAPARAARLFRAQTGLTPRAFAAARRADRVRGALADGAGVTDALYAAGFNAAGRFYAAAPGALGMTPSRFRSGGAGERLRVAAVPCALGRVLVALSDVGVAAVLLGDDDAALEAELRGRFPRATLAPAGADDARLVGCAAAVVDGAPPASLLPMDVRGTAFQARVWAALREIPAGQTLSYAQLAARIGSPAAVRAVAGACAANNHAVAIPCHRVVRSDGGLSGYAWGPERKRALLNRERGDAPR